MLRLPVSSKKQMDRRFPTRTQADHAHYFEMDHELSHALTACVIACRPSALSSMACRPLGL
jgi:hypothetical protein